MKKNTKKRVCAGDYPGFILIGYKKIFSAEFRFIVLYIEEERKRLTFFYSYVRI